MPMGSWGYRTFEDDTALDWIGEFGRAPSLEAVAEAVQTALGGDFLDDLAGAQALAAAEVVAALHGHPSDLLSEPVARWAADQPPPDAGLRERATQAVSAVFRDSELREIWEDADGLDPWREALDELRSRLASPSGR
jgi:hypothetical protein